MDQNETIPKTLVVGINPWRDEGVAHALRDIFSCWDASKLALLYTKSDLPYTTVASRFFQIDENQVLKNLLKPWRKIGKEVENTKNVDKSLIIEENRRYARAHKHPTAIMPLLREFVWLLGRWRSNALKQFLLDFDPELLFIPVYPTVYMGWLQRFVIRQTGKPFVCYIGDDNYSYKSCKGILSYLHRFWLRKNVRWLSTHCQQMFVVVEKAKEETDRIFGTDSLILAPSVDLNNKPYAPHTVSNPIKFVYTGKLVYGRDKTMALVADAINEINDKEGIKAELDIYSSDEPNNSIMKRLNRGASHHKGLISRSEVDKVQREADVVVFVEALEGKSANIARLSLSTKTTDYLANGKCVLAIGKKDIAPIDYFYRNDSAIIATNNEQIREKIQLIIDNPTIIGSYSQKAYNCACRNHDKTLVESMFIETMKRVLSQEG